MKQYPVTIDNGGGEELTFVGPGLKDGVECMIVENKVTPRNGPPMHVHYKQYEEITILEGTMGTLIQGGKPRYYHAGDTVLFEPGVAHKFWNAGDTMLVGKGAIWPVHNIEYFLTEIFKSAKANNGRRPAITDMAFLLRRYRAEFDMMEIPGFVKKLLLPVAYAAGYCTGAFRKYRNAP